MSWLKDLVGGVVDFFFLRPLVDWVIDKLIAPLLPKPEVPEQLAQGGQVYNADLRTNIARIGQPKPELFGEPWYWPALAAPIWWSYVGNQQVICWYGTIGVGEYDLLEIRIGETPLDAYADFEAELLPPGTANPLFHTHVYSAPEASGIDLRGGAYDVVTVTGAADMDGNTLTIAGAGFDRARKGTQFEVAGTVSNDGTYTIIDTGSNVLYTAETFTTESTGGGTNVTFDAYTEREASILAGPIAMNFNSTLSEVTASVAGTFSEIQRGDLIGFFGAPGTTDGTDFEVLEVNTEGNRMLITPAPVSGSLFDATIRLLRRWSAVQLACKPLDRVSRLQVDVLFPQGLGRVDGSDIADHTVGVLTQYREVDDYGRPLGPWVGFPVESITRADRTPQRVTLEYDLPSSMRVAVRVTRSSSETGKAEDIDAVQLIGLRGFVDPAEGEQPETDPDTTRLALRIRTSSALAESRANQISVRAGRKLPVWNGSAWVLQRTRNPAWALAYWIEAHSRGLFTRDSIPIAKLTALASYCDTAGITYDEVVDLQVVFWEQAMAIARIGRGFLAPEDASTGLRLWQDVARAPVGMLVHGYGCEIGSVQITPKGESTAGGVVVQFMDPTTWQLRKDEDGAAAGAFDSARKVTLSGCTDFDTAWREAQYQWAEILHRNEQVGWMSDLRLEAVQYGDVVLLVSRALGWGDGAPVVDDDGSTLTLLAPVRWPAGAEVVSARLCNGGTELGAWITCTKGAADNIVVLGSAPDIAIGPTTELAIGWAGFMPAEVVVRERTPESIDARSWRGTVDAAAVYADPGEPPDDRYTSTDAPLDLEITGFGVSSLGNDVSVSWSAIDDAQLLEVSYRRLGQWTWTVVARRPVTGGPAIVAAEFEVAIAGEYQVRLRAFASGRIAVATAEVVVDFASGALELETAPSLLKKISPFPTATTNWASASAVGGTPPYAFTATLFDVLGGPATLETADENRRARVTGPRGCSGYIRFTVTDDVSTVEVGDVPFMIIQDESDGPPAP